MRKDGCIRTVVTSNCETGWIRKTGLGTRSQDGNLGVTLPSRLPRPGLSGEKQCIQPCPKSARKIKNLSVLSEEKETSGLFYSEKTQEAKPSLKNA
jgi:hypothetical protein